MIVTEAVEQLSGELRGRPDPVLAEMEAQAAREGIPIVVPETGALLHVLARARARGGSSRSGPRSASRPCTWLARCPPAARSSRSRSTSSATTRRATTWSAPASWTAPICGSQDAREGLAALEGPFDMAFIDGVKAQYGDYFDVLLPLLRPRAVLAVDNVLMSGTVAEDRSDGTGPTSRSRPPGRSTSGCCRRRAAVGTVTPVGDGVLVAVRS